MCCTSKTAIQRNPFYCVWKEIVCVIIPVYLFYLNVYSDSQSVRNDWKTGRTLFTYAFIMLKLIFIQSTDVINNKKKQVVETTCTTWENIIPVLLLKNKMRGHKEHKSLINLNQEVKITVSTTEFSTIQRIAGWSVQRTDKGLSIIWERLSEIENLFLQFAWNRFLIVGSYR